MRVRGKGSIAQVDQKVTRYRCRRWELRVAVGRDPLSGRYVQRTRRFNGTLSEAKAALIDFVDEIEQDAEGPDGRMTFAQAADEWMARREDPNDVMHCSYGTTRKNRDHLRCLNMHMGNARVAEVTPQMVEEVQRRLACGDSPSGRPLSGTYRRMVHQTCKMVFDWLVRTGAVRTNPCLEAVAPTNDTEERRAVPKAAMVGLMGQLEPYSASATAILLDMMLGLRSCESVALDWGDVDLAGKTVSVRKSSNGREVRDRTKTAAGMRTLPLMPDAEEMLRKRLMWQEAEHDSVTEDTPICCDRDGVRVKPHSVVTWWRRNRDRLGMPDVTPHQLRHSYLTHLYRSGVDLKVIQRMAGHSRYSTTADIYVHVDVDDLREAVSKANLR